MGIAMIQSTLFLNMFPKPKLFSGSRQTTELRRHRRRRHRVLRGHRGLRPTRAEGRPRHLDQGPPPLRHPGQIRQARRLPRPHQRRA